MSATPEPLIGWIVPDDGVDGLDYETLRLNPWLRSRGIGDVRVDVQRSHAEKLHSREDLLVTGDLANLLPAARRLAEAGCAALMWACTSGSFIGGLDWARRQAQALTDATGLPASSTTLALLDAAAALDASHVDVLGAYPESVTRAFVDCFRDADISVQSVASLGMPTGPESFHLDLVAEVRRFADRHIGPRAPLVIPDTAINSLDLITQLEAIAERPVITANQASLWKSVAMVEGPLTVAGLGALFRGPGSASKGEIGRGEDCGGASDQRLREMS